MLHCHWSRLKWLYGVVTGLRRTDRKLLRTMYTGPEVLWWWLNVWLQFSEEARNLSTSVMCSRIVESLDSLLTTRSKFINDPLFHSDLSQLLIISEYWTFHCLTTDQRMSTTSLSNDLLHLWNLTDLLFNSSSTFGNSEDLSRYTNIFVQIIYYVVSSKSCTLCYIKRKQEPISWQP